MNNYNKNIKWHDLYRGIGWEITARENQFRTPYTDWATSWCHYIHLNLDQLPPSIRDDFWLPPKESGFGKRKRITYDYMDSIIYNLEWHGGCTYYDKTGGFDGEPRRIKAGCDYQHYWDEGKEYDFDYVLSEAKATIDSLHALIPGIGVFCRMGYCDKLYHLEEEGEYSEDKSSFICKSCLSRVPEKVEVKHE